MDLPVSKVSRNDAHIACGACHSSGTGALVQGRSEADEERYVGNIHCPHHWLKEWNGAPSPSPVSYAYYAINEDVGPRHI